MTHGMEEARMNEMDPRQPLVEYAAITVARIISRREQANTPPYVASMSEIQTALVADLRAVLNNLVKNKTLMFQRGLNDTLFSFTPPK